MEKIKIRKKIFAKNCNNYITWKDLKHIEFQDDDIIDIEYVESSDGTDGYLYVEVFQMIVETDEEFQKRIESTESAQKLLKKNRYERYLELKKEFENG